MLEFELRTTEKSSVSVRATGGIHVPWNVGTIWEDYHPQLVPIGTFCVSMYGGDLLEDIKNNNTSYHVVLVADHVKPSSYAISNRVILADPYQLVSFYVPLKGAIHASQPWSRTGNGTSERLLTMEELTALFQDDRFLAIFSSWRQKTGFEFEPVGLGEGSVEMSGETGAKD